MEDKLLILIDEDTTEVVYLPVPASTACDNRLDLLGGNRSNVQLTQDQTNSLLRQLPNDHIWTAANCASQ